MKARIFFTRVRSVVTYSSFYKIFTGFWKASEVTQSLIQIMQSIHSVKSDLKRAGLHYHRPPSIFDLLVVADVVSRNNEYRLESTRYVAVWYTLMSAWLGVRLANKSNRFFPYTGRVRVRYIER